MTSMSSSKTSPLLAPKNVTPESPLSRLFAYCNPDQVREFSPERRSLRIGGHSTTIRLERAYWTVLEEMAREEDLPLPALITKIADHCLTTNDKNLASCLRVVCLKYINISAG